MKILKGIFSTLLIAATAITIVTALVSAFVIGVFVLVFVLLVIGFARLTGTSDDVEEFLVELLA